MKGKVTAAAIILFFLCGMAYAQDAVPENYIVVKPGIFYPRGDIREMDTGFNGEIAFGRRFHQNFSAEIASGYVEPGKYTADGTNYSLKTDLYIVPVTVAFKGILPVSKSLDVYGILGGGGYYVHGKLSGYAGPYSDSATDSVWILGGFAGAGASYNITRNWFVGLEGRYLWTDKIKMEATYAGETIRRDFKIEGVQGLATIGFKF